MQHLFNSRARVEELQLVKRNGRAVTEWVQAVSDEPAYQNLLEFLPCRADLQFVRPGKDAPEPITAGRATDRSGVLFADVYAPLRAGQRIVMIPDEQGNMAVKGMFSIKEIPDTPTGYYLPHHLEVFIVEVAQDVSGDRWPGEVDENNEDYQ